MIISIIIAAVEAVVMYYAVRSFRRRIADALRWISHALETAADVVDDRCGCQQ